jgi:hypothetical protein
MNKKLIPAITFGLAVLLIGSIAYASDRRRNAKSTDRPENRIHEEEVLRSELLEAVEPFEPSEALAVESDRSRKVAALNLDELIEVPAPPKPYK